MQQRPGLPRQLFSFSQQQAVACAFPFSVIALLALTKAANTDPIPRYDVLFVACVAIQVVMLRKGFETKDEAKTVALFHLVGLGLELYKVDAGSWSYPDPGLLRIGGVPLFSGFLYAAVGSYVCQAWRRLDLRALRWPSATGTWAVCAAIYANFFTNHHIPDLRWWIVGVIVLLFRLTWVSYRVLGVRRRMPVLLSFGLIGLFVWVAENIGTRLRAWQYPYQVDGWRMVDLGKVSSWALLVIISVAIVAQLKIVKRRRTLRETISVSVAALPGSAVTVGASAPN